jgi:hypothetical protein
LTWQEGMMAMGLLGVVCYATTRHPTPPRAGAYGRGADAAARILAIPLMIVGVVGVMLWVVDGA